jgi:hypothetical protein
MLNSTELWIPIRFHPISRTSKSNAFLELPECDVYLGLSISSCDSMYSLLVHINQRRPHHAFVPCTCPSTVPSNGGFESDPFLDLSFSHSSGVWHLALHACIAAISSLSAAFTARCRFSELRPENWGETMSDVNDWPQPPGRGGTSQ